MRQQGQALNGEVSHYTVGLSHGFFHNCGWLERLGGGEYVATDLLFEFSRHESGSDCPRTRSQTSARGHNGHHDGNSFLAVPVHGHEKVPACGRV
jgi:hypothetical protein